MMSDEYLFIALYFWKRFHELCDKDGFFCNGLPFSFSCASYVEEVRLAACARCVMYYYQFVASCQLVGGFSFLSDSICICFFGTFGLSLFCEYVSSVVGVGSLVDLSKLHRCHCHAILIIMHPLASPWREHPLPATPLSRRIIPISPGW